MAAPLVSIIVPTKNSAAILPRLLDSLRAQTYQPREVIVVDNHSTDGEPELVRSRYPEARFFTQGPERNVQRNFGARQARGEFVMFFDSDMELRPTLVSDCVHLANEGADAVIIPEEGGGSGYWAECQKLEKRCYFHDPYMEAANRFIRTTAYWKVGGYSETMVAGEDFDISDKLKAAGFKIARTEVALVHHEPAGFWSVVRKKFYYGSKMRDYFQRAGATGVKRFAPVKPAFLRQWRLLARDPIHAVGLLTMKTAQWTAGLLGLTSSYLKPAAETTPSGATGVLLLPLTFPPDVGGVETHLSDLLREIRRRDDLRACVCTFKPIVTAVREYRRRETDGNVEIRRFWWLGGSFGGNLFRKLEPYPALLFLYITPYFFARALWFMLWRRRKVDVIHVHGLNMAFTGLCLGWLFRKPVIMQTHALYSFRPDSRFGRVARSVLLRMSAVLSLGSASRDELVALGVPADRVTAYRYWIDLERFSSGDKASAKQTLGWPATFTVLFVARLMDIKGTRVVCKLAERFPQLRFVVAGDGPDKPAVFEAAGRLPNLHYAGLIQNADLPVFYRAADLTLVPSLYPEGFGRVICESLACGTPVVASRVGGIPDAMDDTVGMLCTPDEESFEQAVREMVEDRDRYACCQQNARTYAERRFSAANAEVIFAAYERARRAR